MPKFALATAISVGIVSAAGMAADASGQERDARRASYDQTLRLSRDLRAQWDRRAALGQVPDAPTEPTVTRGTVLTPTIDVTKAPGLPEIQLTIDDGTAGANNLIATLTSPSGQHSIFADIQLPFYPPAPAKQTVKTLLSSQAANNPLGLYAEPGAWTISQLLLFSKDGQIVSYDQAQVATLFGGASTISVLNPGTPDTTPPTVKTGQILTRVVSLASSAPYAAVKVSATDDISGIAYGQVYFSAPGGYPNQFEVYGSNDAPSLNGSLIFSYPLPANLAPGTYTIISYEVCDFAANCVDDNNPADIAAHFAKTTISVTQ